jgi:hypothetical protein
MKLEPFAMERMQSQWIVTAGFVSAAIYADLWRLAGELWLFSSGAL